MLHNVITTLLSGLQITLQALSHPAWQGIGVVISVIISFISFRKSASKIGRNLNDKIISNTASLAAPVTHLPKSVSILVDSSIVSTGMDFSTERIFTMPEPSSMIFQRIGRCTRVADPL